MRDPYKRFRIKYGLPIHFNPSREKDPTSMWDKFLNRTIERILSGEEVYKLEGDILTVFVIEQMTRKSVKIDIYVGNEVFYYTGYAIPNGYLPEYDTKCKLLDLIRKLKGEL